MTALRKPPKWYPQGNRPAKVWYQDYEDLMVSNQIQFHHDHRHLFDNIAILYAPHFESYQGCYEEASAHHDDPHAKRDLRIASWRDLMEGNRVSMTSKTWIYKAELKAKKDEIAKNLKRIRMIADLGCPASLRGFRVTEFLKRAQSKEDFVYKGITAHFCKAPAQEALREVFQNLINPPQRGYFVYFSDDSCLSLRVGGKVHMYNIDISSCDASHGRPIFRTFKRLFPKHLSSEITNLLEQCKVPLWVYSRHNRKLVVALKPDRHRLYSGATITTGINNVANQSIFMAIAEHTFDDENKSSVELGEELTLSIANTGYHVTCETCEDYYDLQFLKNSPVYDTEGKLQPLLNLGVMIRASGNCRGDLPGRGDLETRARVFQASLLHGMYPVVSTPLVDWMKECTKAAPILEIPQLNQMLRYKGVATEAFTVTSEEVNKRYRITESEFATFMDFLHEDGYGTHITCSATNKYLQVDYGLSAAGF